MKEKVRLSVVILRGSSFNALSVEKKFRVCQCPRRNRLCLYLNLIELIALIVLDLRVQLARRSQTIESLSLSLSLFF